MKKSFTLDKLVLFIFIFLAILTVTISSLSKDNQTSTGLSTDINNIKILSSYENEYLETTLKEFAKKNKIKLSFTYMGDLDIIEELNSNSKNYDAVWISNSMWLYMLDKSNLISNSKSISISPIVFGIKKSKAKELDIINKNISNNDILELIQNKKIKYVMSSVTQTNTGATAYFGFLNSLAGNPEILTEEMLEEEDLLNKLKSLFSGVQRVSGNDDFLKQMFLNNNEYEAVIASESSLININKELISKNKEELYLIYPTDGVAVNDSTLAFISNIKEKEENFLKIQNYLLSDEGQKKIETSGMRTWYGGINQNVDKNIFNPDWGIDTTKYLKVTKFPSKKVMNKAINIYIENLRKPTHVVFCLDYSGSMYGNGIKELRDAMEYILDYEKASLDKLQFSKNDKITVITFSDEVTNIWNTNSGYNTQELIKNINTYKVGGSTALYDAIISALNILKEETDEYTKTIIAMTDGAVNVGNYNSLVTKYNSIKDEIPVYSITFGSAVEKELNRIASLTNSKVFDGKNDLLQAFKEVRGYN